MLQKVFNLFFPSKVKSNFVVNVVSLQEIFVCFRKAIG